MKPHYYIFTYREYPETTAVETVSKEIIQNAQALIKKVGHDLTHPKTAAGLVSTLKETISPEQEVFLDLPDGGHALRYLSVQLGDYSNPQVTRSLILRIKFDQQETIWCPVGDFFGAGIGLHPFDGWYRSVTHEGVLSCRWVMPYEETASLSLLNLHNEAIDVELTATTGSWVWGEDSMYFHSNFKAQFQMNTQPYADWNYIRLIGKGVYVGDTLTIFNPVEIWWGEGDAKIWVDGESFPSIFGTGTEDYYAYAYGGRNRSFYDHPFHAQVRVNNYDRNTKAKINYDRITQGYSTETRTRALDAMPFHQSLQLDMEIWHWDKTCQVDYSVATYWYGFSDTSSNIKPMPEATQVPVKD